MVDRIQMDQNLRALLSEIEDYGKSHDVETNVHSEQLLNITPDTGLFLSILILAIKPKNALEIGTSNAYSTLWIADAVRQCDGRVTTLEISDRKSALARKNIARSGLEKYISFHQADARSFLKTQASESYDFIFLDAERPQYISYWPDLDRILKKRALLVVDNALSPRPEELVDFFNIIHESRRFLAQLLHIGKGEFVAVKLES